MKQKIKAFISAIDKQAHFGWGGMIAAFFTFITLLQEMPALIPWSMLLFCIIGTVAALVFEIIKEIIDDKFEWSDILATFLGTYPIWMATAAGILLNHLMH